MRLVQVFNEAISELEGILKQKTGLPDCCKLILAVATERTDDIGDFMVPVFKNRIHVGKLTKAERI